MFPSGKCTSGGSATNEATPSSYIGYVSYLATQGVLEVNNPIAPPPLNERGNLVRNNYYCGIGLHRAKTNIWPF